MWVTEQGQSMTFFTELDVYAGEGEAPAIARITDRPASSEKVWAPEVFNAPLLRRLHAIWALGQVGREDRSVIKPLVALLEDPYFRIRAQAARTLGNLRAAEAGPALAKALTDDNPRVRGFAATAVGKSGYAAGLEGLMALIAKTQDTDAFLRHHAIYGLECLGDHDALLSFAKSPSPAIRLAVQQVLRRARDPRIAVFLHDEDPTIVAETISAIHDQRIDEAEPELADKLTEYLNLASTEELPSVLSFDRMINANVRLGKIAHLKTLIAVAESADLPERVRVSTMNWLGRWQAPHHVDPIIGQLRAIPEGRTNPVDAIKAMVERNIGASDGAVRSALFHLANRYDVKLDSGQLQAQAMQKGADRVERLQALEALLKNPTKEIIQTLATLSADPDQFVRIVALQALAERDTKAALAHVENFLEDGTVKDMQTAYALLGTIKTDRAVALLVDGLNELMNGRDLTAALEVISSCAQREEPEIKAALTTYEQSLSAEDKLAKFRVLLKGGDITKGAEVLQNHGTAQCIICHNVKGKGGVVAPDLAQMGSRAGAEYLLESLVLPSATVVPGFGNMTVMLKNGSAVSGSLLKETETDLLLKMPGGSEKSIAVSDIASRTNAISSMPPMTAMLKKHEIRDVIAYLVSLNKTKRKKKKGH
jgi:quinoprotein glucose dehydrogenase